MAESRSQIRALREIRELLTMAHAIADNTDDLVELRTELQRIISEQVDAGIERRKNEGFEEV